MIIRHLQHCDQFRILFYQALAAKILAIGQNSLPVRVIQHDRIAPLSFIDRYHYRGGAACKAMDDGPDILDAEQGLIRQANHHTGTGLLQGGEAMKHRGHLSLAKICVVDNAGWYALQQFTRDFLFVPYDHHQFNQVGAGKGLGGAPLQCFAIDG